MTPEYIQGLEGPDHFTIMGIDPGSTELGIAALNVDFITLLVQSVEIKTINMMKPSGGRETADWMLDVHSARSMRMHELSWMLGAHLVNTRPVVIACEAPFFNPGRPNAYQVLVETVKTIENTVFNWCPNRPVYRIETSVAKAAVTPSSPILKAELKTIKDSKEKVKFCVQNHSELSRFIDFNIHDEHGADAAIVAYAQLLRLRQNDFSITF